MMRLFQCLNHKSVYLIRKDAEITVMKVPGHVSGCGDLFVKVYELRTLSQKVKSALRLRRSGWRDLSVSRRLKALGIDVPEPVGACNYFSALFAPGKSLFANRWLDDAESVRDAVVETCMRQKESSPHPEKHYPDGAAWGGAVSAQDLPLLCQNLGQYIRKLHDKGIGTSDLNAGNIMIRLPKRHCFQFALVDYERIIFRRRISWKQRLSNLAQVAAFMCVAAPTAVADLANGYNASNELASGQILIDALHYRTSDLKYRWKNREDENFESIYQQLHKRS